MDSENCKSRKRWRLHPPSTPNISRMFFSSHSLLFYNMPQDTRKLHFKSHKERWGWGPESYATRGLLLTVCKEDVGQTARATSAFTMKWHRVIRTIIMACYKVSFLSASSWFPETWISHSSGLILPTVEISPEWAMCSHLIAMITAVRIWSRTVLGSSLGSHVWFLTRDYVFEPRFHYL